MCDSSVPFCQLFGVCNDLDLAMRKCTRKERLERTQVNLEESRARQKAARTRLSEMEAQVLMIVKKSIHNVNEFQSACS